MSDNNNNNINHSSDFHTKLSDYTDYMNLISFPKFFLYAIFIFIIGNIIGDLINASEFCSNLASLTVFVSLGIKLFNTKKLRAN